MTVMQMLRLIQKHLLHPDSSLLWKAARIINFDGKGKIYQRCIRDPKIFGKIL